MKFSYSCQLALGILGFLIGSFIFPADLAATDGIWHVGVKSLAEIPANWTNGVKIYVALTPLGASITAALILFFCMLGWSIQQRYPKTSLAITIFLGVVLGVMNGLLFDLQTSDI